MRNARTFLLAIMAVTLAPGLGSIGGALAQAPKQDGATKRIDFTAQKKKKAAPKRAPTRVVVQRAYPYYLDHSIYPRVDDVSFPGPNGVRECTARLVQEHRPSGTVIVPRTHCWWQAR